MQASISSPNDWLTKIGCQVQAGQKLSLPSDVLLPMNLASVAIDRYRQAANLEDQLREIQLIAINTRSADTAFFANIANKTNAKVGKQLICDHCVRRVACKKLVQQRRNLNKKIIHVMDKGSLSCIHPNDFQVAIDYYNSLLEQPLLDWTEYGYLKIEPCNNCKLRIQKAQSKQ